MAKCDVSIVFDRSNRTYTAGEQVSGEVIVQANQDVQCNALAVECFWQTHGRGNHDTGDRVKSVLFQGPWRMGETARYPFRFTAPAGPATYRGHHLNVDHYVAARVDLPWAFDPKCQEEYLLIPAPPDYDCGVEPADSELPKHLGGVAKSVPIPIAVAMIVVGGLFIFPCGLVLIPLGLAVLFFAMRNRLAEKRIGEVDLRFDAKRVVPGEDAPLEMTIRPVKATKHNGIRATFVGKESATSGSGTNSTTHTHELHKRTIELVPPGTVSPGSPLHLKTVIPIPKDAAYSFFASDNKILWTLEIRIDIPLWPDWVESRSLLVRPFKPGMPATAATPPDEPIPMYEFAPPAPSSRPADVQSEPMATSDEGWESPFAEAEPAIPSPPPATAPTISPLVAVLADISATDRFGGRREAKIREVAGQEFAGTIVVESVGHTYGYVEDRRFRDGRTVQGALAGSDQEVAMLFRDDRNAQIDELSRGDRIDMTCQITDWEYLSNRATLQEA